MDGGLESIELRAAHDRVKAIHDAVDAPYVLSVDGEILEASDALCRLLGYAREELIGLGMPWPFWPQEGVKTALDIREGLLERGVAPGLAAAFQIPLMDRSGKRFLAYVRVTPAILPDGTFLGWVSTVRDLSERRDYEAELERLASQDPLTGLANRRLFERRLDEEISEAQRLHRPLAIAVLDLDHFKLVNDRHGHPVGDQVLRDVATRLGSVLRKGDLLARLGGEEFGWILPEIYADGAVAAAERARRAIGELPFSVAGALTVSIGVALLGDARDAQVLYAHADEALYRAKREGRDRTTLWSQQRSGSLG